MTKSNKMVFLFAVTLLLPGSVLAGSSWWERGLDFLKSAPETSTLKEIAIPEVLGDNDIGDAFKEALRLSSNHVVQQLGGVDGFNGDPVIHIPLPKKLKKVKKILGKIGMSGMVDDLELKINRAAEAATPKAKALFMTSIDEMTFDDIHTIYKGPQDSATQYFKQKMSPQLREAMTPIIEQSLADVGAIKSFQQMMGKYEQLPFVKDVHANLVDYVLDESMDGIFHYIAKEEAAIRQDPLKQSTDLLKKVFKK